MPGGMTRYTVQREIGKGSFGRALLCTHRRTGLTVVVKQIDVHSMDHEGRVAARAEAVLLSKLAHPSILHHHESFEDLVATDEGPARRTLCIVTEFCDRGDLTSQIQQRKGSHFPESEVLEILAQICLALSYIHSRKVLHRDLKPQNVFVSRDGSIRLGDFGIARVLRHTFELAKTVVGTPIYLAPEVVESKPYGARADVWSLGVVLYEVMALRRPFSGSTIPSLVRRILRGKYAPLPSHYSEELRGLAHLMLSKSPGSRPSVAAVLQLPMMRPAVEKFIGHCRAKRAGIAPEVLPRELRFLLEAPGHRDEDDGDGQQRHDESASGSDPDDVAEVAHIRVSGSTIDLTGAARDGPPLLRLEALRQYLADQLGQTDFLKLYASLKEDGGEGRRGPSALDDAWAADLGSTLRHHFRDRPERFSYIPVVEQLLRLEEAHFCEGD
ncbi:hypothetical protein FNF31_01747 [Cafeteria roenbergensis]|uniref:non-specific serine/threonine protein kinase n=1 Tax=Cafeteria roenbergensis TaxID=33653 RepID=A0A5A8DPH9_CAFRO|nr:hypothetical protein FNF31_01747 [Cafeteria roenbergensis]